MDNAPSPCVKICSLDPQQGVCSGCGRTLAEISGWIRFGQDERLMVLALLPGRLKRLREREAA
jgi:predicted Fe-S protein YdhL (DUF1289 family)